MNIFFYILRKLTFDYYPLRKNKKSLLVLMFHQVNNRHTNFYPSMPVDVFRNLCLFFKKHYEIIHISEVEEYFKQKNKKPAAVISFDDGNYDIFQNAFPILKDLNLKFNINIDTEILETFKSQDFVRVYDILNTTNIESFVNPKYMSKPILINKINPIETENEFTELLSNLTTEKRRDFVLEMADLTKMEDANYTKVVNKEHLKILSESGLVEIGSHSHSHSIFTKISRDQLKFELQYSKEILEKITEKDIEILAYPNGKFNDSIDEFSKEIGYKYILKTNDRFNRVNSELLSKKHFERVNQYHRNFEIALAHTYGVLTFIRKFIK